MVTVVLDLSQLSFAAGVDERGPVLLLLDGSTRVEVRAVGDRDAALASVQRLIQSAARLGRELAA